MTFTITSLNIAWCRLLYNFNEHRSQKTMSKLFISLFLIVLLGIFYFYMNTPSWIKQVHIFRNSILSINHFSALPLFATLKSFWHLWNTSKYSAISQTALLSLKNLCIFLFFLGLSVRRGKKNLFLQILPLEDLICLWVSLHVPALICVPEKLIGTEAPGP